MSTPLFSRSFQGAVRWLKRWPLVTILEVPYLLQFLGVVGCITWCLAQHRQVTLADLATQLGTDTIERVWVEADQQLAIPVQLSATHAAALETGLIDPDEVDQVGRFFWQQMQIYPVDRLTYHHQSGETLRVIRQGDGSLALFTSPRGSPAIAPPAQAPAPLDTDPQPVVRLTVGDRRCPGEAQHPIVAIAASHPLSSPQGNPIGRVNVDLGLAALTQVLQALATDPTRQIFIVERNGQLVATSDGTLLLRVIEGQVERLNARHSPNPLVRDTMTQLGHLGAVTAPLTRPLRLPQGRQWVSLAPWPNTLGLDWVVVVIMPEADLARMEADRYGGLRVALMSLAIALLLALLAIRWINRPLGQMTEASQAIARGQLHQTVAVEGPRPVREATSAFNRMAAQNAAAFQRLADRLTQVSVDLGRAEVTAQAAQQTKTLLLANVSHQLRTPLNVILGFLQVMRHDTTLPPSHRETLDRMHRSAVYLLAQINNLLLTTRLLAAEKEAAEGEAAEGLNATPTWVDLRLLIQSLQGEFLPLAQDKSIQFALELDKTAPQFIYTDKAKLYQSLAHLLDNALKFTIAGQVVLRVTSQPSGSSPILPALISPTPIPSDPAPDDQRGYALTFAVVDTGPGIDSPDLERLFSPFEQTEVGQESQLGSGLGLFISHTYVHLLGGDLRCQSRRHQGSCFEFTLHLQGSRPPADEAWEAIALPSISATPPSAPTRAELIQQLAIMPKAWCEDLRLSATIGDDGAILALLQALPSAATLGECLGVWAADFQFDRILELIQEVVHDRSGQ